MISFDTFFLDVLGLYTEQQRIRIGDKNVLVIMNDLISNNEYYFKLNTWNVSYITGNMSFKEHTNRVILKLIDECNIQCILVYGVIQKIVGASDNCIYLNEQPTTAPRKLIDHIQSTCQNTFNVVKDVWINTAFDQLHELFDGQKSAPYILVSYGGKRSLGSFLELLRQLLTLPDHVLP